MEYEMLNYRNLLILTILLLFTASTSYSQFRDDFNDKNINGWFFFTGDGNITMDLVQMHDFARINIDATKDKNNIWWTVIKRDITEFIDLNKLKDPSYELRVEAKVRVSDAPKRVNFMINTQRTVDYHKQLMEYEIPDTSGWHVISFTTHDFDAIPGDTVYVQFCATDWGWGKYYVDLDYYHAEVINVDEAGPNKGIAIPYHPPIPHVNTFQNHPNVGNDCLINSDYPKINFNDWHVKEKDGNKSVLTINEDQWAILNWDLTQFKNMKAVSAGLLELTTQSVPNGGNYIEAYGKDFGEEFGKVRVIEIFGGDPVWNENDVTYNSFMQGETYPEVFNTQMVYDFDVNEERDGKNFITISQPVLQRMIDGKTKGLMIRPLGTIDASFYASENENKAVSPKLHFNIAK